MRMKVLIGRHQVLTENDALELALGTPLELWLGTEDETIQERAARLDAARDILTEDPELFDHVTVLAAELLDYAPALTPVTPLTRARRALPREVAA